MVELQRTFFFVKLLLSFLFLLLFLAQFHGFVDEVVDGLVLIESVCSRLELLVVHWSKSNNNKRSYTPCDTVKMTRSWTNQNTHNNCFLGFFLGDASEALPADAPVTSPLGITPASLAINSRRMNLSLSLDLVRKSAVTDLSVGASLQQQGKCQNRSELENKNTVQSQMILTECLMASSLYWVAETKKAAVTSCVRHVVDVVVGWGDGSGGQGEPMT